MQETPGYIPKSRAYIENIGKDIACRHCGATRKWEGDDLSGHWVDCPLHAAAPDMLDALRAVHDAITYADEQRASEGPWALPMHAATQVLAAIASATGAGR